MKRYEIIFIVLSDVPKDQIDDIIERYKGIVSSLKGIVIKVEKWGTKKLAYKIEKQGRGFYVLMDFAGEVAVIRELERNLKFDDKVLRYLTVKKADLISMAEIEKEMAPKKEQEPKEVIPAVAPEVPAPQPTPEQASEVKEGSEQ